MARSLMFAVALAATSAIAPAQTFVVDAANGPGTNFTDLPPAVAAVPDGAVLLVRAGTYGVVNLDGKGLSVIATAPQVKTWGVSVVNLAASQAFTLRGVEVLGLGFSGRTTPWASVYLRACAGPVLLQAVTCQRLPDLLAVFAGDCSALTVRESVLDGGIWARNSQVAVESSDVLGSWESATGAAARPGVTVEGGTVTMARSRVSGGGSGWGGWWIAAPAVELWALGELRLCEDPSGVYAAGQSWNNPWPTPAIGGAAGTVVVRTPEAALTGSHGGAAVAGPTDVVLPMPSLRTQPAGPGGTVIADITTPVGELVLLAVGLPGPVTAVPGIEGSLWLDAATAVSLAVGVPQPGTPVQHAIGVPNTPSLIAVRFCWQAVAWSAANGLRLGNPSTLAL